MQYTHIVWDFNGTLLNDVEAGIAAVNDLLHRRGLPEIENPEQYRKHFRFPIEEYYRDLGFDFSRDPYAKLAIEWVERYPEESRRSSLFEGAEALLRRLHQQGIPQLLLSATQRDMLCRQVREWGIESCFDEIYGLDDIHAHSKRAIGELLRQKHPTSRLLVIGDTLHDSEVAEAMGADCVLFAGGHQGRERLEASGRFVFDELSELEGTYLL